MELLEGVVGQNLGADPFGDAEDEGISPADGAGRWGHQLAVGDGLVEDGTLAGVDAVTEGGIDHDDHLGVGKLGLKLADGVVELLEARGGTTLGRDVRAVDDDMGWGHDCAQSTTRTVPGV